MAVKIVGLLSVLLVQNVNCFDAEIVFKINVSKCLHLHSVFCAIINYRTNLLRWSV